MRIKLSHNFEEIINVDNLLLAWKEFIKGKRKKKDVQEFSFNLMDNILELHYDLKNKIYKHGGYFAFKIHDPKPRDIHKASVRDRLVHRAIYRMLYPFFDKIFVADSYSCRLEKGTHKAIKRFTSFNYTASKNNTKTCWVLKCDIRKFFANIDHQILVEILKEYIPNRDIIWLLEEIINSFYSIRFGIGLPLGNLTSQLFVNIYMNKLDQFVKHKLKAKHYIRYADDFVILSSNKNWLLRLVPKIDNFLRNNLKLFLHPDKINIKTVASGADFLGWVNFSGYRVLRTLTKRRMLKRIQENPNKETLNSYLGFVKHGNANKFKKEIFEKYILGINN